MKNLKLYTILSALLLSFIYSCDDPDEDIFKTFNDFQFVTFDDLTSATLGESENIGTFTIPIRVSVPNENDLTINFTVQDSTAIENTHYTIVNNTVVIPAGEFVGNLEVEFVDNDEFNATRFFTLNISSISDDSYQVGTGLETSFSKLVGIVNDDCPSQSNLWWGNITFDDVGFDTDLPAVGSANAAGECDILLVSGNLPNNGAGDEDVYPILFTPFFEGATNGVAEVPFTLYRSAVNFGASGILDTFYGGSGTYDEMTGEITIFFTVEARNPDSGAVVGNWFSGTTIIKN